MDRGVQERMQRLLAQNRRLRKALARERQQAERLRHSALHDTLTSLPNRALLMDRLEQCVARAARDAHYRFAVLFLDIDDFKFTNDSFGHEVGDAVLLTTAQRLNHSLRQLDTVSRDNAAGAASTIPDESLDSHRNDGSARLGGDEFVVVLDDVDSVEDVMRIAERLQKELAQPIQLPGRELAISTSMGISIGQGQDLSVSELLREADAAMYRAKLQGKGGHALFDGGMQAAAARRMQLHSALHSALERNELEVVFQPIVALREAQVRGFEALLRWHRPEVGTVDPGEFISLAEQTGEILPIQHWVLEQVMRQVLLWNRDTEEQTRVWASINISGRQLEESGFSQGVLSMLHKHSVSPQLLNLELKLACLQRRNDAQAMLQELRSQGVRVCIDNFGSEALSLVEMSRLPVDLVKIDREVASMVESNRDWTTVVQAMTTLSHALHKRVVVVGIESSPQMEQVERAGADFAQGHFFARPLSAEAAFKFVKSPPRWRMSA